MRTILKIVVCFSLSIACTQFPDRPPNIFINVAKSALTVFAEDEWSSFFKEAKKSSHELADWLKQKIKMDRISLMRPKMQNGVIVLQFDFNQLFKWLFAIWILLDCLIKLRLLLKTFWPVAG